MKIVRRILIAFAATVAAAVGVVLAGLGIGAAIYDRAEQSSYDEWRDRWH